LGNIEDTIMVRSPGGTAPIPLTVLTGFLGSGKTTVLNRLLHDPALADAAVIINEFGEIGLDHLFVEGGDEGIVELSSGCLCCTIRGDLVSTLEDLLRKNDNGRIRPLGRIIIETTGLADPAPVLHTVMLHPYLVQRFRLDGVVVTFDAVNGPATLLEHEEAVKQLAMADRIVVTKTDLLPASARSAGELLGDDARALNPAAPVVDGALGGATVQALLNCGLYDPKSKIADVDGWLRDEAVRAHANTHAHGHDVNRHGARIRAFTLQRDQPVSVAAVELFIDLLRGSKGPNLLRVKGIIQLAEDPERPLVIHGVQDVFHPPVRLPAWPDASRQTRIVFITRDLDGSFVERMFDAFADIPRVDTPDRQALAENPLAIAGSPGRR
jgi:G3E family GTPase